MNLPTALAKTFVIQPFQAILEILPNGQVAAWVPEFPDSKIVAVDSSACAKGDRTTAISELEQVLKKRLESIERVAIAVDSQGKRISKSIARYRLSKRFMDDISEYTQVFYVHSH